ncbi:phytoene desaturase family protein [Marinilabiliaceae bacterium ANBcel2]|nr:phytoene desaturase family protein [Marinilabiliaceae bacterium ANBcel2]
MDKDAKRGNYYRAGIAGLATALRLAVKGYKITVIEKHHQAGGRLNTLSKDGFTFDMGPTFFSMSYEFDKLIDECNIDYPFEFIELDPLFTVNIKGVDKPFTIYKDIDKLTEQFIEFEPNFKEKITAHLNKTETLYHDTVNHIVHNNFDSLFDYFTKLTKVPLKHTPLLYKNMWSELCQSFDSQEARMIFSLVGFFLGATPFDTPAVYSLLNYVELKHDGYHNVKGGMYKIVEGVTGVLKDKGVQFIYNTEITGAKAKNGTIDALTDKNGKEWRADAYIINSDAAWFRGKVLKHKEYREEKLKRKKWTMAPLTIYLGVKGDIKNLSHHNYFLGNNFNKYANRVFKNRTDKETPYYYVNVQSMSNPNAAPTGHQALFILIPSPHLLYKKDWSDKNEVANRVIEDLSNKTRCNIMNKIVSKTVFTPYDWRDMFNLYKGSGLGLAHDMSQTGWFRPANRDKKYKNIFFTGASTIPGTGLPMAVISSGLTTERVIKHLKK